MSAAQWRVFGILLAILGIEVVFSDLTRGYFRGVGRALSNPTPQAFGQILTGSGSIDMSLVFLWALSAVILLGIADVAPQVGTWIAFLILVGVVLANGDRISSWINATVKYMNDTRNGKGGSSSGGNPGGGGGGGSTGFN